MWYTWPGSSTGHLHDLAEAELGVARGRLGGAPVPAGEPGQEDPQRSGLHLVEARVVADELERRLVEGAVEAQHPDALGHLVVAARDEAAVAEGEEVLRREEAEGRADARARDAGRAERLSRVLDQRQAERRELGEVGAGGRRGARA